MICKWAAQCECTFEGVPIHGGGGRRYNAMKNEENLILLTKRQVKICICQKIVVTLRTICMQGKVFAK